MWRDLSNAVRELWHASGEGHSAYRPDLHYMRGPGPKWHAKYGTLPAKNALKTPSKPSPTGPVLREAASHHA